jgi:DNA-binding phage protein
MSRVRQDGVSHPVIAMLGEKILSSGKSLRQLSNETGIDKSMLHRITKGDGRPSFERVAKVAAALGGELRFVKNGRAK